MLEAGLRKGQALKHHRRRTDRVRSQVRAAGRSVLSGTSALVRGVGAGSRREHHREFGDPKKGDYARPEISSAFTGSCERPRRRLSSKAREEFYDRCRGDAECPSCNIWGGPVLVGDAWDENHDPDGPLHCFGGEDTGVAHRACNRRQGAEVVRPMDAKATRSRQKHIGAFQTRHKLPGGRTDWRKRKLNREVVLGPA
jgi:hypothetical protein